MSVIEYIGFLKMETDIFYCPEAVKNASPEGLVLTHQQDLSYTLTQPSYFCLASISIMI